MPPRLGAAVGTLVGLLGELNCCLRIWLTRAIPAIVAAAAAAIPKPTPHAFSQGYAAVPTLRTPVPALASNKTNVCVRATALCKDRPGLDVRVPARSGVDTMQAQVEVQ